MPSELPRTFDLTDDGTAPAVGVSADATPPSMASSGGPPYGLSHASQLVLETMKALDGERVAEAVGLAGEAELAPLPPAAADRLIAYMDGWSTMDLVEFARQRGNTSVEHARRFLRERRHAQLLDDLENVDTDLSSGLSATSDATFVHDDSDSSGTVTDTPLPEGFYSVPDDSPPRMSAADELRAFADDDAASTTPLQQLLASTAMTTRGLADIATWASLFRRLPLALDFIQVLDAELRRQWALWELCTLRMCIIQRGLELHPDDNPVTSVLRSWNRICSGKSDLLIRAQGQTKSTQTSLFLRDYVPPLHSAWVGFLFSTAASADVAHVASLIAIEAAATGSDWVAVASRIAPAAIAGSSARTCILSATSSQGLREYLRWLHELSASPTSGPADGFLSPPSASLASERLL